MTDSNFLILLIPFVAFVVFFSTILIIRTVCGTNRRKSNWATQRIRSRRQQVSVASSSSSVEVQTQPPQYVPPPRYYPPEVTATESSAMYPIIVPYYNPLANQASLRDPRQFQGLPGLVAPPPYPEPPSYSQISSYPDLPIMSRLEQAPPSRQGHHKKGDPIAPVE